VIVDSSALIAILKGEPERDEFLDLVNSAEAARIAAPNFLETAIVVDRLDDPVKSRRLDDLLDALDVQIVDSTAEHAHIARAAYRDYGRGSGHPARLNFGDCFAYALARATADALLFKGNEFTHTDIAAASARH
jgi:ribonuclease VapC